MSKESLIKRYLTYAVMLVIGVLIGMQLMGAAAASTPSLAEGVPAQALGSQASFLDPSAQKWYTCTPWKVATYSSRVHVECTVADGDIKFFAAPTSDYKNAARVLSLALTAQATGSAVEILYDDADTSGTAYGCQLGNCRPLLAIVAQ